ncbi:MAG: hypothetical protein GXP22_11435 [Gammaproteobacteria bacterium]|nr:hypothetical protein [Gammaproteobacteria bacterium]
MKIIFVRYCMVCLLAIVAGASPGLNLKASEFRAFSLIRSPSSERSNLVSQSSVALKTDIQVVSSKMVQDAVSKLVAAWNSNGLSTIVTDSFIDKSRLLDSVNSQIPRDAQLRVLAIQNTRTLNQHVADSPSGKLLVSLVSTTLRTQLEFNDPAQGFQRREGTNEYILRIKQRYTP